jgi:2-methylcitrate dehydratase PrpD
MSRTTFPTRRRILQGAGALAASSWLPGGLQTVFAADAPAADVTGRLARYMVSARSTPLPPDVAVQCKNHIVDSFGAMVSGSRLKPGLAAAKYVKTLGGTAEVSVIGASWKTTTINAALVNAMFAHSDETDDFEAVTKAHPGSAAVPAALAMAEKMGSSGEEVIRAVALGYDMGCRLLQALGPDVVRGSGMSAEGTSSTFSALGAAASLARFDELEMRYAISYAAQQVSGLWSWVRDTDHIEKSFDFAGMGARNALQAVTMVQAGLTGVKDVLDGKQNLIVALSKEPRPEEMVADLGKRFYITETAIKTFSVGYPIQSVLDAFLTLRKENGLTPQNVQSVLVKVPTDAGGIVGDSAMPDVNAQHMIAVALVRGAVSFVDSHDAALMRDETLRAVRTKVTLVTDKELDDPAAPRGAIVEVTMADGKKVTHHTRFPPGTRENPLSVEGVTAKVRDLMLPVLGADKTTRLLDRLLNLEKVRDLRELRPLLIV